MRIALEFQSKCVLHQIEVFNQEEMEYQKISNSLKTQLAVIKGIRDNILQPMRE